jgi:hypothetical protein
MVCGTIICPPNSQKYADKVFTRFKGIIHIYFEKVLSVRNNFDYFCTIELRRIDL